MANSARGGRIGIVSGIVLAVVVLVGVGLLAGVMAAVVAWELGEGVVLVVVLAGVGVAGVGVVVPERIATRLARDRIGISGIVLAVVVLVGVWVGVSVLVGVWVGVGVWAAWELERVGVVLAVVALVGVGVLVTVGVAGAGVVVPERIAMRLARDRTGIVSGIVLAVGVLIAGGTAVGILVGVWAQAAVIWLEGYGVTVAELAAEGALMSVLVVVGVLVGVGVAVGARAARRRKHQGHAGGRDAAITKDG